jgi:hypothetical protein
MNWGITVLQIVNGLVVVVGVPWTINLFVTSGKKLQLLDSLEETIKMDIKPDLKNLRERFAVVEDRVNFLWKDKFAPASSPRQLNERGQNILEGSGIKKIIDSKKTELFAIIRGKNFSNPYDAEQGILSMVDEFKNDSSLINKLKTSAFSVGAEIDAVLLVGGIYLRDLIFEDLGFSLGDLDKHAIA